MATFAKPENALKRADGELRLAGEATLDWDRCRAGLLEGCLVGGSESVAVGEDAGSRLIASAASFSAEGRHRMNQHEGSSAACLARVHEAADCRPWLHAGSPLLLACTVTHAPALPCLPCLCYPAELLHVGQKQAALQALHDLITSKRYRTWQKAMEKIMFKYVELCVDMRKGRYAKDGLIQYRISCQQVSRRSKGP